MFKTDLGILYNKDCLEMEYDNQTYDIVITSPPYNIGINYDVYNDARDNEDYFCWIRRIFSLVYQKLNSGGRLALNVPYELKINGIRMFAAAGFYRILSVIGFKWAGLVDLKETKTHKSKLTAWGSWLSQTVPYIYNPKECLLIVFKDTWKRSGEKIDILKEEFIELVVGEWSYRAETKKITQANFSLDIPLKALKILALKNDVVLDLFMGSGTTAIAAEIMGLRWVGYEISKKYCEVAKKRLQKYVGYNNMFI
jgi:site-specific DNA-methyltransferase (adenine-specific)